MIVIILLQQDIEHGKTLHFISSIMNLKKEARVLRARCFLQYYKGYYYSTIHSHGIILASKKPTGMLSQQKCMTKGGTQ